MKSFLRGLAVVSVFAIVGYLFSLVLGPAIADGAEPVPAEQPEFLVKVNIVTKRSVINKVEEAVEFDCGSGALIGPDYVLTAHHVVRGLTNRIRERGQVNIETVDGQQLTGTVEKFSVLWDLALVKIEPVDLEPVALAEAEPTAGDEITVYGFPGNKDCKSVSGPVAGFEAPSVRDRDNIFIVRATTLSGMSGGPAVNESGELAGVMWGSTLRARATSVTAIRKFLAGTEAAPE